MNEQLAELSKTINLTNSHTAHQFNTLTKNCPKELVILAETPSYFCKANLIPKLDKNILEGTFLSFHITIQEHVDPHSSNLGGTDHSGSKKLDRKHHLKNQTEITAHNFRKFLTSKQEKQQKEIQLNYNQFVDFDRKILKMFMAMRYEQNYSIKIKDKILSVDCETEEWRIPLIGYEDHAVSSISHSPMKATIDFIKTLEYLTRVQTNLENSESITCSKQQISLPQSRIQNSELILQNNLLKQKLNHLETQFHKSRQKISELQQQIKGIQAQLYRHGEMIEIEQNKRMKILDQLEDLKKSNEQKANSSQLHLKSSVRNKKGVVTVPDVVREKLSIDLHSSYLGKFDISGNQITYIGEDQQATQLLSSRIFGHSNPHKKLKSTLHIIKTQAKCIKFGIIDNKYVTQRSCWNYPHIIYLHGWGHTMVSRHEQNHNYCDFGTGSVVEMQVDFGIGWIKWTVNGKKQVILKQYDSLIKSDIQWTPFIAMHNYLDCVEWSITQN